MYRISAFLPTALVLVSACAAVPPVPAASKATTVQHSLLSRSTPANGAIVKGPVENLQLYFSRPVLLGEVTVTGSDGSKMPMMVHAVGEVTDYSLPLGGLGAGRYTVDWRASSVGQNFAGQIYFNVK